MKQRPATTELKLTTERVRAQSLVDAVATASTHTRARPPSDYLTTNSPQFKIGNCYIQPILPLFTQIHAIFLLHVNNFFRVCSLTFIYFYFLLPYLKFRLEEIKGSAQNHEFYRKYTICNYKYVPEARIGTAMV